MLGYGIYRTLKDRAIITGLDCIDIDIPELVYQKIELSEMNAVEKALVTFRPDVLVHTAALVNVDRCEENPREAEWLNVEVTRSLARLCNQYGIKMVYISSDAVFAGTDTKLYTEKDKTEPINVYGRTKLEGEFNVLRYQNNLVLRTNIYGINIQKKQSLGEWVYHSLNEGKTLDMFKDIDFSPILTCELAELIYHACKKQLHGIYHACGTGCISKYDFGIKLKEICHIRSGQIRPSKSTDADFKARRAQHMGMCNRKLTDAIGIKISTPEESIETFNHLMKTGEL